MVVLLAAAQSAHLGAIVAALGFGLLVTVVGHLTRQRFVVVTGLLLIALVSVYFSFVLQPSGP
jgi:hypothetical protein